jgi:hypothetical protein
MMSDTIQRVFVKTDDTATIDCPECRLAKTVVVGKFRSVRHTIKARCTCGHSFTVSLDFRRYYRKNTKLEGRYETQREEVDPRFRKETNLAGTYSMQVTNLSCGGLQFSTHVRHALEVGQQIRITFTLDDKKQTEISKLVIMQSITNNIIGCRFAGDAPLEQALRFYLFP